MWFFFWDYLRQHSWAVDVRRLSLDQLKQVLGGQVMGQALAERTGDLLLHEDATSSARRLSTWKGWWPTLRRDPRGYANSLQFSVAGDASGDDLQYEKVVEVQVQDAHAHGKWKPTNFNDQTSDRFPRHRSGVVGATERSDKKGIAQMYKRFR